MEEGQDNNHFGCIVIVALIILCMYFAVKLGEKNQYSDPGMYDTRPGVEEVPDSFYDR